MRKFLFILSFLPVLLWGQSTPSEYLNNPAAVNFNWNLVSTDHFDIHFYSKDPVLASEAAKFAEESLYDISELFTVKPKNPFNIYLFLNVNDLIHSNQYPDNREHLGGVTPMKFNSRAVVYNGSAMKLHQDIKTAVAKMMMDEFYFGNTVSSSIQNSLFLYQPEWFKEGLPRFIGEGWTFEDEAWVAGLDRSDILGLSIEGDNFFNQTLRKSIWYYVNENHGKEKLGEIFYMARLHHSVEAAVIRVLGIKLETLTERWREFLLARISENEEGREDVVEKGKSIPLEKGQSLVGFAVNPVKPLAAVMLEKDGIFTIKLFDLEKEVFTETGITDGRKSPQYDAWRSWYPMAWNTIGDKFFCVFPGNAGNDFLLYDHASGRVTRKPVRPLFDEVTSISWSHDDSQVAVSAFVMGAINIYTMSPSGDHLTAITDNLYDNVSPVWSADDQLILFASNKPVEDTLKDNFIYNSWSSSFDVFSVSSNGNEDATRITQTQGFSEVPVGQPSGFEVMYLTDEAGVINLGKRNLFIPDSTFLTNITQGFLHVSYGESYLMYAVSQDGVPALYFSKSEELLSPQVVLNSRLRHTIALELLEEQKKKEEVLRIEQNKKAKIIEPTNVDPKIVVEENRVIVPDSVKSDSLPQKTKFYVFDGDESPRSERKTKIGKTREKNIAPIVVPRPDFGNIVVKGPERSNTRWAADEVTMRLGYDPVFKLYMQFEAGLTDTKGDKHFSIGFRPFIDRKCSDFFVRYELKRGKLDYNLGFERMNRFINKNDFEFRYQATSPKVGAVLPFNHYSSLSASIKTSLIRRIQLDPFAEPRLDGMGVFPYSELRYEIDRRKMSGSFARGGLYLLVRNGSAFRAEGKPFCFNSITTDFRKYIPLGKNNVLAVRMAGGASLGPSPQRFYLGGVEDQVFSHFGNTPDFSIDKELQGFYFSEYVTPIRGFLFNARSGSKYLAANVELRIPVSRIGLKSLNPASPNNVEFIPFFDFGTAWTEGNPFSQKNPINAQQIDEYPFVITIQTLRSPFVVGFGSGLRLNVFGYSTRIDLAWGVEDYDLTSPKIHISLGKNF